MSAWWPPPPGCYRRRSLLALDSADYRLFLACDFLATGIWLSHVTWCVVALLCLVDSRPPGCILYSHDVYHLEFFARGFVASGIRQFNECRYSGSHSLILHITSIGRAVTVFFIAWWPPPHDCYWWCDLYSRASRRSHAVDGLRHCGLLPHACRMSLTPEVRDSAWWFLVLLAAYYSCILLVALGSEPVPNGLWLHTALYFALIPCKPGDLWHHLH